jgi:hypothetical protein
VLFLSDAAALGGVRRQRESSKRKKPSESKVESVVPTALDPKSFEIVNFTAGFKDDRVHHVATPSGLFARLMGPDFNFHSVNFENQGAMRRVRAPVLSFGHKGSLVLQISQQGELLDKEGPDFVIYENVMNTGRGGYYQEPAYVGVAMINEARAYTWFACRPLENMHAGCAGILPTDEGGDAFDLASIGIARAKFIKIVDVGYSYSHPDARAKGPDPEGFDLDSVDLLHAYSNDESH